jgi:hypothetical protein
MRMPSWPETPPGAFDGAAVAAWPLTGGMRRCRRGQLSQNFIDDLRERFRVERSTCLVIHRVPKSKGRQA